MRKFLVLFFILTAFVLFADQTQIVEYNDSWNEHGFSLEQQGDFGVRLNYSIKRFTLGEETINGELLKTVSLPGNFLPNDEGMPNLPGNGRYIAIPQGSTAELQILNYRVESYQNIDLAPAFRIPLDTDDGPLEYTRNNVVYSTDEFYPKEFAQLSKPTQIRGVDVVMIGITPFQYNPITKELLVYRDIELNVNFIGGNGQVGVDNLRSRWWDTILQDAIINNELIPIIDYSQSNNTRDGYEYLIICPDDATFLAWADSIKVFRQQQGISTVVMTTAEVGGNTVSAIEGYIDDIMDPYTGWDPAPSAILLMGDYGTTGNTIVSPMWNSYCVSDNIYADVDGNSMPDVILARMTAQDATQLETMVTKFLDYERTPPTDPDFYDHPITALGYQTERWFQICSESVAGFWEVIQGKTVNRINAIYSGNPVTGPWSTATNTATVLNVFGPNGLGYIPATPGEVNCSWYGTANDVINGINDGAFMLQHRDHGSETGWGEPAFQSSHINSLTNTDLPFIFSINCLTGKYNMAGECFAEKFHRYTYNGENSGCLGIIAASEISYSFVNDTYVWGMYDNMWPDFMPDYGTTPDSRGVLPAFANAAGKYFLEQSSWPYNTNNKEVTYNLFHHHGDAFSVVYSEVPQDLTVLHDPVLLGGLTSFTVLADVGSFISLTIDNEIIGTGVGTGAPVSISIESQMPGTTMLITVTKQNYFRYTAEVPVIPPTGSYVVFNDVTIDDTAGNGNGLIDFSETVLLSIGIENIGTVNANNVIVTLSTEDEYITITDNIENYGTVNAGTTVTVTNGFEIDVDGLIPDQHSVIIELNATDGSDTWTSYFSLNLNAPVLEIGEMLIDDSSGNDNGVLDPGESVTITIPVNNNGHAESPDAIATLACVSTGITIGTETVNLGPIGIESSEDAIYIVTADASVPFGTPITLSFSVIAGEYEEAVDFPTQVGIHREDFESGGFVQFPWEFQGYDISWPNVNPIEDFTIVNPIDDVIWSIDTNEFYSGAASAKSYPITHNQASFMSLTLDVTLDGEISFWFKVACEYSPSQTYFYDGLFFIIDGETADRFQPEADGSSPWTFASYPIEAGTHTFDWVYVKDSSDGTTFIADDCAWVDFITFPSIVPIVTGTIEGTVTLVPAGDIENVEISIGAMTVNPDVSGAFTMEIPVGIYDVTASLEVYETIMIEDVEVLEGQITSISFELHYLQAPENLQAAINDNLVDLSWEHNQPTENSGRKQSNHSNREFQNFNIYRNMDGGNFELLTSTTEMVYEDILEEAGEYEYYITAMYDQENESEASNIEIVIWDGTEIDDPLIPIANALYQNSPNPFNPHTRISFDLMDDAQVSLEIFNMKGQKVKQLINSQFSAGQHSAIWNGKDDNNKTVSSGIYFYKFKTGDYQATKKMLLLK
ncbi:MAG: T9SS type A sorting domain-containing protein [Candidatus Cloacimonetes bacterium]|nr:T9SS type A sorting domain-containing protein [Candidatus Cloacimonadota bacterium]